MGRHEDILNADPKDRSRLRAAAHADIGSMAGQSITRGNHRITFIDGPTVDGDKVTFSIRVEEIDTGENVTPPDLNPITIVNPPTLVPDPTGTVDLGDRGKHAFDPRRALLSIIRDLIQ